MLIKCYYKNRHYLQKQVVSRIWFMGPSMLTPALVQFKQGDLFEKSSYSLFFPRPCAQNS